MTTPLELALTYFAKQLRLTAFEITRIQAVKMDSVQTHPVSAAQAKSFIAPGSLSYPSGAGDLTPPSENGQAMNGQKNGQPGQSNGAGVTPATPAATPGATATQGVSGIVPTLQYVSPLPWSCYSSGLSCM